MNQTIPGPSYPKLPLVPCISLLFIFILIGCATYDRQKQQDSFEDITEAYGDAIRWGRYEVADGFRDEEERKENPDFNYLKKIRVTSYELKAVNVSADGKAVQQDVEIQYYNIDHFIEKTIIDSQMWRYDEEEQRWFLHSALPDFE